MRPGVLAPLVAAAVGIVAGTVTAIVAVEASDDEPSMDDPLGLGIPLVNRDCAPGQGLLVLGYGETSGALQAAKRDNPRDLDLSYLETADSCDTQYGPERFGEQPTYAVVAGPFSDLTEPCELRMTPDHRGDSVTNLRSGNEITVKCVCVLDAATAPELEVGMEESETDTVWIRSLQQMLVDRELLPKERVSGVYDAPTRSAVIAVQKTSSAVPDSGVVDTATWRLVATRFCGSYSF